MPTSQMSEFIQRLRGAMLPRDGGGLSDAQLLEDYICRRDEAALAALVRRHAPMVWGVCRRVLRDHHNAEDAFQATFVVLVRKASSIASRELLANWLYGVAYQTALKARATAAKRSARERQVMVMPESATVERDLWHDLQPILDEELSRLPDKYRVLLVLCDLESKTRKEVAELLGCPEGTVAGRLARARVMLAKRLARRGVVISGGALAALLSQNAAAACVPAALVSSTIKAATLVAAGPAAAAAVSAPVAALAEGVLKAMFLTKLKIATVALLVVALLGTGTGWLTHHALAEKPNATAEKPTIKKVKPAANKDNTEISGILLAVDAAQSTIRLQHGKPNIGEETYTVGMDAKVLLDDGTGGKLGFQYGTLADLLVGTPLTLRLADQKVTAIWAEGPTVKGTLKVVNTVNNTITATVAFSKTEPAADYTFTVPKNAKLFIDDGDPVDKTKPARQPTLADLLVEAVVVLKLSADRKVVGAIHAEGQTIIGRMKGTRKATYELANRTKTVRYITVTTSAKGEPEQEREFLVAQDVHVYIDDGQPVDKTKPTQPNKLENIPVGCQVALKLSINGKSVLRITAEGGTAHGIVHAIDAAKNTLTVRNKLDEEKTFTLMSEALILIDDKSKGKKLADVPLGAIVELKLLADQQTVRTLSARGHTVTGNVVGNAGNESITLGGKEGDTTYTVPKDTRIAIEDKKAGKLTDLIEGSVVHLRLAADQSTVLELRAEGPSFRGFVKNLDADKNTITLLIGSKNGEGGEDKEFKFSKDTAFVTEINGAPLKLSDVRTEKEVTLKLAIDQKSATRIVVLGE